MLRAVSRFASSEKYILKLFSRDANRELDENRFEFTPKETCAGGDSNPGQLVSSIIEIMEASYSTTELPTHIRKVVRTKRLCRYFELPTHKRIT